MRWATRLARLSATLAVCLGSSLGLPAAEAATIYTYDFTGNVILIDDTPGILPTDIQLGASVSGTFR